MTKDVSSNEPHSLKAAAKYYTFEINGYLP